MVSTPWLSVLKFRLLMMKNRFYGDRAKPGIRTFLMVALFIFIAINIHMSLRIDADFQDSIISSGLLRSFYFTLFTLLFLGSLTASTYLLFYGDDIPLLCSFPLTSSKLVLSKTLEAFLFEAVFVVIFAVPMLTAAAKTLAIPPPFWPLLALALFTTMLLAHGSGLFISLLLTSVLPKNGGRTLISLIASTIGVTAWMFFLMIGIGGEGSGTGLYYGRFSIFASSTFRFVPFTWGADAVQHAMNGQLWSSALTISAQMFAGAALVTAAVVIGSILVKNHGPLAFRERTTIHFPALPAIVSSWTRDLVLIARNPSVTGQIFTLFLASVILPSILEKPGAVNSTGYTNLLTGFSHPASLFVISLMVIQTGMLLVPLEGKGAWIIKTAPSFPVIIVVKKIITASLPGAAAVTLTIMASRFSGNTGPTLSWQFPLVFLITAPALSSTGCHFGFRWGNYAWEHPRDMLPQAARYLPFLTAIFGFIIFGSVAFFIASTHTEQMDEIPITYLTWAIISAVATITNLVFSVSLFKKMDWSCN